MPPTKELQKGTSSSNALAMTRSQKRKTKAVRKAQREHAGHPTAACATAQPPQPQTQQQLGRADSSLFADKLLASSSSNLLASSAAAAEQQRLRAPPQGPSRSTSSKRRSTASGCGSGSRAGSRRGTPCVLSPRCSTELDREREGGWLLLDDKEDLENGWVEV